MLRFIKTMILGFLGAGLVLLGVANMAPVDIRLLPEGLGAGDTVLHDVPLAAVMLDSVLVGMVIGQLLEWLRERKHRVAAEQRKRELGAMKAEIARLSAKLAQKGADDLPRLPAPAR